MTSVFVKCLILLYVNLSLVGPFATVKIICKFKIWRETPKAENFVLGKTFILMESKKWMYREKKKKKKESEITDARGTEELRTFLIANYFVQKRTLIVSKQEQAQKVKEMTY